MIKKLKHTKCKIILQNNLTFTYTQMSQNTHTCTSRCCNHESHDDSPHGGVQLTQEQFREFLNSNRRMIASEQRAAAKKALKIKLKNKKNQRTGANEMMDMSGNEIQTTAARRAFIMEHLARTQLMEAMGMGENLPTIASIVSEKREKRKK